MTAGRTVSLCLALLAPIVLFESVAQAAQASQAPPADTDALGSKWVVGAFSGGGFAGANIRQAVQTPAFDIVSDTLLADSVDLVQNEIFRWKPTLAAGVVFRRRFTSGVRAGISGYFAFLTEEDGNSNPVPGFAFHLGGERFEAFIGYIFTSSNDVVFPDRNETLRVGKDNIPDLEVSETRSLGRLYVGFTGPGLDFGGGKEKAAAKQALIDAEATAKVALTLAEDNAKIAQDEYNQAKENYEKAVLAEAAASPLDKQDAVKAKDAAAQELQDKSGTLAQAKEAVKKAKEVLAKATAGADKARSS